LTERRPHIAGAVGAAITKRYFELGWSDLFGYKIAAMIDRPFIAEIGVLVGDQT
jgi:hypothetical protein